MLTGAYLESQQQGTGHFTNRFLWTCGNRLFSHDFKAAVAVRSSPCIKASSSWVLSSWAT